MRAGERTGVTRVKARPDLPGALAAPAASPAAEVASITEPGLAGTIDLRSYPLAAPVEATDFPAWLRAATLWHRAPRVPAVMAADIAILALVSTAASGSPSVGAWLTLFSLAAALGVRIWRHRSSLEAQGVGWYFRAVAPAVLAAAIATKLQHPDVPDHRIVAAAAAGIASLCLVRGLLWQSIGSARRRGLGLVPTLLVGSHEANGQVSHRMALFPESGLRLAGSYTPQPQDVATPDAGMALVRDLLSRYSAGHIVVSADATTEIVVKDLLSFGDPAVEVSVVHPLTHFAPSRAHVADLAVMPVPTRNRWVTSPAKRAFDLALCVPLLLLASPVLALTALAVRLGDRGPAIFAQRRCGRGGHPFTIYKFRSMVVGADRQTDHLARDQTRRLAPKAAGDPRITRVGAVIRRFSVDELPQLFNVLKGDMSLVGPRPLPIEPDQFDPRSDVRHRVRPGLTGIWQTSGANALMDHEMIDLDLRYVTNGSLAMDVRLMMKTIPALLIRRSPY
jgi:lipopolysaccharide/colanic/teichoic acid biosynthesis glycosyltransferase